MSFALQVIDFLLQSADVLLSLLNRGSATGLLLPSLDLVFLLADASLLGVDLLADSALLCDLDGLHDEPHAAGLAGSVLLGAVLAEVAPLVVAASHSVLVIEAHLEGRKRNAAALVSPGLGSTTALETRYCPTLETHWLLVTGGIFLK